MEPNKSGRKAPKALLSSTSSIPSHIVKRGRKLGYSSLLGDLSVSGSRSRKSGGSARRPLMPLPVGNYGNVVKPKMPKAASRLRKPCRQSLDVFEDNFVKIVENEGKRKAKLGHEQYRTQV